MKLLSVSFLLILLSCALLLSRANESLGQTQSNPKEGENRQLVQQTPTNQPPPANSPNISQGQNDKDRSKQSTDSGNNSPLMIVFNAIVAVATVAVAIFNFQLVKISRDMHKASESAAQAAKDSAKAALAALQSGSPFLFAQRVGLHFRLGPNAFQSVGIAFKQNHPPRDQLVWPMQLTAHFQLRNAGQGPAMLREGVARLAILERIPPINDFTECRNILIREAVIAPIGEGSYFFPPDDLRMSQEEFNVVQAKNKRIFFYGQLVYDDVFHQTFETIFLFEFDISTYTFIRGPRDYNRYRKC